MSLPNRDIKQPTPVQKRREGFHFSATGMHVVILLIAVALFVVFLTLFAAQYETNDDAAMNMYAAGTNLGQAPSEFLLFQHFIIGLVLKFLYVSLPHFPWYGVFLYAYLFVSSVAIGYALTRIHLSVATTVLWLALFFLFYLQVLITPQFTVCSGYLALGGVALLYAIIYKPSDSRTRDRCLLVLAIILLIWAGMVRFYSLLLALLAMGPLYGYALATRFTATWRRLLPLLYAVAVAAFLVNWTQLQYYKHVPGWEHFFSYNDVRADFMDRHRIVWNDETEPFFKHIGWSRVDLAMLMSWFYLDPKVYSFHNLAYVARHSTAQPGPPIAWDVFQKDLQRSLMSYGGWAALLLCALILLTKFRRAQVFAVVAVLWYVGLFAGITVVERHLPARVWLVMLCSLFLSEVILWSSESATGDRGGGDKSSRSIRYACLALGAAGLIFLCAANLEGAKSLSDKVRYYHGLLKEDLTKLNPRRDQLFVTWGGDFPYETFQLPKDAEPASSTMQFLGLGVGNHDPVVQDRLRAFGIKDLYQAFYQRDDVFLICMAGKESLLARYIEEHYHTKVVVKAIFQGFTFRVCKLTKEG